jgi:hypothetical protein
VANNNAANLILGHMPVKHDVEGHEHPGQERGAKGEEAEEAEHGVRVPPPPHVHERAGQRAAEELQVQRRAEGEQHGGRDEQQPGEAGGRPAAAFLEQARVALHEEEVEDEVEAERAKVQERSHQSPVLSSPSAPCIHGQSCTDLAFPEHGSRAVEEMEGAHYPGLDEEACPHDAGDPPPCAEGHVEEPLFQGKSEPALRASADGVHGGWWMS